MLLGCLIWSQRCQMGPVEGEEGSNGKHPREREVNGLSPSLSLMQTHVSMHHIHYNESTQTGASFNKKHIWGSSGGSVVKNPPAKAGDMDLTRFLVWKDPTCHRATKPRNHNY